MAASQLLNRANDGRKKTFMKSPETGRRWRTERVVILAMLLCVFGTIPIAADTFHFRDGRAINGEVINQTRTTVTARIDGRVQLIRKDQLRHIKFNALVDNPKPKQAGKQASKNTTQTTDAAKSPGAKTKPPSCNDGKPCPPGAGTSNEFLFSLMVPGWTQWRQQRIIPASGFFLSFLGAGILYGSANSAFSAQRRRYSDAVLAYALFSTRTGTAVGASGSSAALFLYESNALATARSELARKSSRAKLSAGALGLVILAATAEGAWWSRSKTQAIVITPASAGFDLSFVSRF